MRSRLGSLPAAVLATGLLGSSGWAAQPPPLWGKLRPGPQAVGFRSVWQLDYGRRYNMVFDDKTSYASGKAPRPILVNIWYPAEKPDDLQPMRHRDYLAIQTGDLRVSKFAAKLVEYERTIVCKEVMGKPVAAMTDRERRLLD